MNSPFRNPFANPSLPSLADLKRDIEADGSLPLQKRRDISSAINKIGEVLGQDLPGIPANPQFLRRKFEQHGPAIAGIGKRRWSNIRSALNFALRHAGIRGHYLAPLTVEWEALRQRLGSPYQLWGSSRFMRFCSVHGVDPSAVDQRVFDEFGKMLEAEAMVGHPRRDHQTACRVWNAARDTVNGWPQFKAVVPSYRRCYAIDVADCHPLLRSEVERYLEHLQHFDIAAENLPDAPFRPASLKLVKGSIQRYLGLLAALDVPVTTIKSLGELVAWPSFKRVMHHLWDRDGRQPTRGSEQLAWTMRCLAVRHIGAAAGDAAGYDRIVKRMRVQQSGLSTKNAALLGLLNEDLAQKIVCVPDVLCPSSPPMIGANSAGHSRCAPKVR